MNTVKPTTFTLFAALPLEIRLKIWTFIKPGPRNVPVEYQMKHDILNDKRISKFSGWGIPDPVPVILHICQESRIEALKSLQLAFRSHSHESKIYINFDIDTILFGGRLSASHGIDSVEGPSDYLLEILLSGQSHDSRGADDWERIQTMVLDLPGSIYGRRTFCWDEIRLFEGLKKLMIRAWDDDDASELLMAHYRGTLGKVAAKYSD